MRLALPAPLTALLLKANADCLAVRSVQRDENPADDRLGLNVAQPVLADEGAGRC